MVPSRAHAPAPPRAPGRRAAVRQRRVGDSLAPPRLLSGQCGRGDDRVVGGNRFGPTPARAPAGNVGPGRMRTEGDRRCEDRGERLGTAPRALPAGEEASGYPKRRLCVQGRGAGTQHPPRERTQGSKGSRGFPRLPQDEAFPSTLLHTQHHCPRPFAPGGTTPTTRCPR